MTNRLCQLLLVIFALALPLQGQDAKTNDFPLSVHVSRSEVFFLGVGQSLQPYERVEATIDGHHYTLFATRPANTKFSLGVKPTAMKTGDYKARVVEDKSVNAAFYFRQYEFLFADGDKVKFDVIGESE